MVAARRVTRKDAKGAKNDSWAPSASFGSRQQPSPASRAAAGPHSTDATSASPHSTCSPNDLHVRAPGTSSMPTWTARAEAIEPAEAPKDPAGYHTATVPLQSGVPTPRLTPCPARSPGIGKRAWLIRALHCLPRAIPAICQRLPIGLYVAPTAPTDTLSVSSHLYSQST